MAPPAPHPELLSISGLLLATAHRNKNQHRLSKWWKAFSQLRRHVSKLIIELEALDREVLLYGQGHRKTMGSREAVERRVGFFRDLLMPRCFLAFSGLVADNQYAALGLMLMATLGRVRKLILPLGKEEEDEGVEGKTVAEGVVDHEQLDLGEVVRRDEVEEIAGEKRKEKEIGEAEEEGDDGVEVKKSRKKEKKEKRSMGEAELSKGAESTPAKRPKKKRKKGDAFDDLFDSLI